MAILISWVSIGQSKGDNNKEKINNTYITVNSTTLLNPYAPRFRGGYVQSLNNRFSLGLDLGYGDKTISIFKTYRNSNEEYQLWEIRPQLYYFGKKQGSGASYISCELFYINYFTKMDGFYYEEDDVYFEYTGADYRREKIGANIIFGVFSNKKKLIGFNFYVGLGAGLRINNHTNVVNLKELDEEPIFDPIFIGIEEHVISEGTDFVLNITMGIKIDLNLRKK